MNNSNLTFNSVDETLPAEPKNHQFTINTHGQDLQLLNNYNINLPKHKSSSHLSSILLDKSNKLNSKNESKINSQISKSPECNNLTNTYIEIINLFSIKSQNSNKNTTINEEKSEKK